MTEKSPRCQVITNPSWAGSHAGPTLSHAGPTLHPPLTVCWAGSLATMARRGKWMEWMELAVVEQLMENDGRGRERSEKTFSKWESYWETSALLTSRETLSELQTHLRELTEDHTRKSQALSLDQGPWLGRISTDNMRKTIIISSTKQQQTNFVGEFDVVMAIAFKLKLSRIN